MNEASGISNLKFQTEIELLGSKLPSAKGLIEQLIVISSSR